MGYIKNKDGSMVLWGTVTSGPKVRRFDSGKAKVNISVCYENRRNENGDTVKKYLDVDSWGRLAKMASHLERGDDVTVVGFLARDDYRSDRKGEDVFVLKADQIHVQQHFDTFADEDEYVGENETDATNATARDDAEDAAFSEEYAWSEGELPF